MPRISRRAGEVHNVILDLVIDVNFIQHLASEQNLLWIDHGRGGWQVIGLGHQIQNLAFLLPRGIADFELEHEPVDLRFGERISPFLLDWVLSGEDQERFFEFETLLSNRDLLFLHRFEQGALDLGGSTIDFVRQDKIRKDRAFAGRETSRLWIINLSADHVSREHIGRKLKPRELDMNAGGERFYGEGFGQTGHTFEEHVAVGQKTNGQPLHQVVLSNDYFSNLAKKRSNESTGPLNFIIYRSYSGIHAGQNIDHRW